MFAKIFAQIFDSSISSNYLVRLVFEDLLVLADSDGVVDMTVDALARRTNVPKEIVQAGIDELSKPDTESRTPDEDGRRIVPLDDHRSWGWQIVNYERYRNIRDEESRRSYMRNYMRKRRNSERQDVNSGKPVVNSVNTCKPQLAKGEEEAEEEKTTDSKESSCDSETTKTKKHSDGEIAKVYSAYPLKKAPGAARKAIGKAIARVAARGESDPAGFLISRIAEWKAGRDRDTAAGRFVPNLPYPATWFNEERYDEDTFVDEAPAKPSASTNKPVFDHRSNVIDLADVRRAAGIQ